MRSFFWLVPLLLAACGGPEPNTKSQDPYERFLGEKELLAGRTDAAAINELVAMLDDPHYLVVVGAIEVLAYQGRPELIQHFAPRLKHKHGMVRQAACTAIATIQNRDGIPLLIDLLKDPDSGVRRSALKALDVFRSPPPEISRAMAEVVGDKDPGVAYMAHRLLCERTQRTDVPRSAKAWAEVLK